MGQSRDDDSSRFQLQSQHGRPVLAYVRVPAVLKARIRGGQLKQPSPSRCIPSPVLPFPRDSSCTLSLPHDRCFGIFGRGGPESFESNSRVAYRPFASSRSAGGSRLYAATPSAKSVGETGGEVSEALVAGAWRQCIIVSTGGVASTYPLAAPRRQARGSAVSRRWKRRLLAGAHSECQCRVARSPLPSW